MTPYESTISIKEEIADDLPSFASVEIPSVGRGAGGTALRFLVDLFFIELFLWLSVSVSAFFVDKIGNFQHLAVLMVLFPFGEYLYGLNPGYGILMVERFRRHVHLTFTFFTVLIFAAHFVVNESTSLLPLVLLIIFLLTLMPPLQVLALRVMAMKGWWGTPVIVIGATPSGSAVIKSLQDDPTLGMRPVAVLDDNPLNYGRNFEGVPVAGPIADAELFTPSISYAIVALPETRFERLSAIIEELKFPHVMVIPRLQGLQSLWVEARDVNGLLGLEFKKNILSSHNLLLKRVMDLFFGIPLFLMSLPVMALCAIAILIVDGAPVFFSQDREGYKGKRLKIYKLRTMYRNSEHILERHLMENPAAREEWRKYLKLKKDPRIIPFVGKFMRKMSLDELPQLWNVVLGDLSLIGPRVFAFWHLEKFGDEFRNLRRSVRPGLSGLWQVSARNEGDLRVQETLDTYYIRNWSIWMDLVLLGKTVWVVMTGKGAY